MRHTRTMIAFAVFAIVLLTVAYVNRPTGSRPRGDTAPSSPAAASTPTVTATPAATPSSTPVAGPTAPAGQWPAYNDAYEWPLRKLDADQLWARGHEGAGITVAVVDTGVDASHPDLAGAVTSHDLANPGVPGDESPDSHGTEIAGLIAGRGSPGSPAILPGLAPRVHLLDIRVTNDEHHVSAAAIAAGINAAVADGAQIINVSLGTPQDSPALDSAVANAVKSNRLVVAGISPSGKSALYPADSNGSLAVAGTGMDAKPTGSLAGHGPHAVYAPGAGLYSTKKSGSYTGRLQSNDYAVAYVSAAAALLWSADPRLGAAKIESALVGKVTRNNFNVINPLAFMEAQKYPVTGPSAPVTPPSVTSPLVTSTSPSSTTSASSTRSPSPTPTPPGRHGLRWALELALIAIGGVAVTIVVVLFTMAFFTRRKPDPRRPGEEEIPLDLDMEPL